MELLAGTILNTDIVEDKENYKAYIKDIYANSKDEEKDYDKFFENYLDESKDSPQMIVGFEDYLLNLYKNDKEKYEKNKDKLVIIYPKSTINSYHTFIAYTKKGKKLLDYLVKENNLTYLSKNYGLRTFPEENQRLDDFKEIKGFANN